MPGSKRALVPLELPGWLQFNEERTGLTALRFQTPDGGRAYVSAVLYLDRRGRVRLPPNNAYLPVQYIYTRPREASRTAEWHELAAPLVEEMRRRGSGNQLYIPPEITDVRPWTWRGFVVGVRYTYYLDLPVPQPSRAEVIGLLPEADRQIRRSCEKAERLGYRVEQVPDARRVLECLTETESRQGFTHMLNLALLTRFQELLGHEHGRMYVCFDSTGSAASALVVLHSAGARAIEWIAGTKTRCLADGAAHLTRRHAIEDLAAAGATGIDLAGANARLIAASKSRWGARLVPNYSVRTPSLRTTARVAVDWLRSSNVRARDATRARHQRGLPLVARELD